MARIVTETITVSFSRLVRDNADDPETIITQEDVDNLATLVDEIYGEDTRVVEVGEPKPSA